MIEKRKNLTPSEGSSEEFASDEALELNSMIANRNEEVTSATLETKYRTKKITTEDFAGLTLKLLKRNEAELNEAKGILKRYGISDQRRKPKLPGEKGHIEVSEDGTQTAS